MTSGNSLSEPLLTHPVVLPCPILNGGSMPKRSLSMGLGTQCYFVHCVPPSVMSLHPSPLQSQLSYSGGRE